MFESLENPVSDELADFYHHREPYEMTWLDDRIRLFRTRNIVLARTETDSNDILDDGGHISTGSGPEWASVDEDDNPNWIRNRAQNLLRLADYIENRAQIIAAKKAEEAARVAKRRDELASEFTAVNSYNGQLPYTQKLIDRIICLEGAAK